MKKITILLVVLMSLFSVNKTVAQSEPFIGQIAVVAFNYAPQGWAKCEGQLLPIAQNQALFALLGTTYGGDGMTTFALPDLRGRVPMGDGNGPGLTPRVLGEKSGSETNTLTIAQMPMHNHTVNASTVDGDQNVPTGSIPANTKALDKEYTASAANTTMSPSMIGVSGGSQPVNNIQPYTTLTYIIALQGVWPTRP
ncbi:phage Tail Collar domain protein [Flavobacterium cauense R2A-7]|uniref:Microcystin-dependent protein n=1 Tax=Flavobacterium cauense R2A-7 TaxID=1341154 RepID=V6S6K9_9FLAO|nr:tail fiber protein [Flavobacterium cauense]ESU20030.1 phage Tail Collar domain protein [Flavobacterium cauense R2A-7]TWI14830.1 microcystin-dependent protein [Flavobacterium cauense R2A-7]